MGTSIETGHADHSVMTRVGGKRKGLRGSALTPEPRFGPRSAGRALWRYAGQQPIQEKRLAFCLVSARSASRRAVSIALFRSHKAGAHWDFPVVRQESCFVKIQKRERLR